MTQAELMEFLQAPPMNQELAEALKGLEGAFEKPGWQELLNPQEPRPDVIVEASPPVTSYPYWKSRIVEYKDGRASESRS